MAKLNRAQRAAVEHDQGPLLVLAGAGSGKTRVITERIARLVERGVRPEAILAVSFTNKAAAEMAERMAKRVGAKVTEKLWLSTFHSFGVRFISEESEALGHGGRFVIFDQGDALGLVRELLRHGRRGERKLDAGALLSRISIWKNAFLAPGEVPERDFEYDAVARELYPKYEETLRSMQAVDFDDLVVVPARLLRDDEEVRQRWRARFRHLLVDEFQDTNRSQLELVQLLANELRNVCVVGDDDQSIYGWRGADVGNILDFEKHFRGAKIVKLEDNYRSTAPILEVANGAIALGTRARHDKRLRAARGGGDAVRLVVLDDATAEAKFVTREIQDLVKQDGRRYGDLAILYRSNLQARLLEEELRIHDVPYRLFGGTQLFDRKEVKDAAAYLRVLVNPRDELSLRRVLNYPPRGIGATTIDRIARSARTRRRTFANAVRESDRVEELPAAARAGIALFLEHTDRAREAFARGAPLSSTAAALFDAVGLRRELLDEEGGKAGARRWENVQHLLNAIARFEESSFEGKPTLATFLQRITMRLDRETEDTGNRVTLSTLHASKGLEFPVVFLIGCVEGQLPHSRTTDPKITEAAPTDVEEERRLFYVGVTRARDRLYLTRARAAALRGKVRPLAPSRFLTGLPEEHLQEYRRDDTGPMGTQEAAEMAAMILAQLGRGGV